MQIICSGVDGIEVQLWEAITLYRTRISENGPRAALRWGCSCENRFVSNRWHPSFNVKTAVMFVFWRWQRFYAAVASLNTENAY